MFKKKWAVVQELLPFGYRIESTHFFRSVAVLKASGSKYLTVAPIDWVKEQNELLKHPINFRHALNIWKDNNDL